MSLPRRAHPRTGGRHPGGTLRRPTTAVAAIAALAFSGVGVGSAVATGPGDRIGVSGTDLQTDEIGRSANVKHLANIAPSGALAEGLGTDMAFPGRQGLRRQLRRVLDHRRQQPREAEDRRPGQLPREPERHLGLG
uniref:Uncharacterized protein n=1 Tax=Janibacter limosus TaxID=53458 RepID=A0AC61U2E1_9MICO|nr:hypothetical protein [Janibacter limosus]